MVTFPTNSGDNSSALHRHQLRHFWNVTELPSHSVGPFAAGFLHTVYLLSGLSACCVSQHWVPLDCRVVFHAVRAPPFPHRLVEGRAGFSRPELLLAWGVGVVAPCFHFCRANTQEWAVWSDGTCGCSRECPPVGRASASVCVPTGGAWACRLPQTSAWGECVLANTLLCEQTCFAVALFIFPNGRWYWAPLAVLICHSHS